MSQELYLPKHCLIPLAVREDDSIPSDAKIFYGELEVLANKHGYCWASDAALAKMKGKGTSTISRWLTGLEKGGYIRRETSNRSYRDENERLLWKPDRKIYVGDAVSKKVCDNPKDEGLNENPKSEGLNENPKSEDRKDYSLSPNIETTTSSSPIEKEDEYEETRKELLELGVNEPTIARAAGYPIEHIKAALHNTKLKKDPDNASGYFYDQLKNADLYGIKVDKEAEAKEECRKREAMKDRCELIKKSLPAWMPSGFDITIGEKGIVFKSATTPIQSVYYNDPTLFNQLESFLRKCEISQAVLDLCKKDIADK